MPRNLGRKRRNNDRIPIDLKRKKGAKRNSNAIAKVGALSREGIVGTSMDNSSVSLREKMMEKLKGAHFRYLNEMLYKSTTEEAESIFQVRYRSLSLVIFSKRRVGYCINVCYCKLNYTHTV